MAIRRQSLGVKKIIRQKNKPHKKKVDMGYTDDRMARRMGGSIVDNNIKTNPVEIKINKTVLFDVENKNISLSVALPVYNSKKIIWLALESLCNQKNINFYWELLICEEEDENIVGVDIYKEYINKLAKVNCVKVTYIRLDKWVNLVKKWQIMGNCSDINSAAFLLQASDCYSPSIRLSDTYDKIVNLDYDWYDNTKGLFYSFISKRIILYDIISLTNLSMGFKTKYAKNIPNSNLLCGIDGFLFKHAISQNNGKLNVYHNNTLYFDGLDTHGLNNISKKREEFFNSMPHIFKPTEIKLIDLELNNNIIDKLKLL